MLSTRMAKLAWRSIIAAGRCVICQSAKPPIVVEGVQGLELVIGRLPPGMIVGIALG